jgi:hypothetical protein
MVSDRGDRRLFIFLYCLRLFLNVFPFPVCKAQLLGDWYEYRRGAPNTIIFLIIRQYIGAPMYPAPIVMADRTQKKIIGSLCLVSIAYWRRGTSVRQYIGAPIPIGANSISSVVRIGTPNPLTRRWVCPTPLVPGGGTHLLAGKRVGGVPIRGDQIKKFKKRRTEHFGAPHLFSSQSPINWALQTGNGNTLKKRRRQH